MSVSPIRMERLAAWQHAQAWPHIADFVDAVTEHCHGEWTTDQMKADILMGRYAVVVVWHGDERVGAVVYSVQNRRNERVAFIAATGGRSIVTPEDWAQLTAIFKAEGATAVEAAMRPSMARLCRKLLTQKYIIVGAAI